MKGLRQSKKAGQMYKEIPKQVRNDNTKRMHKFSKGNIQIVVSNGKKMSFDVNVLSTKPVIKAAASMQNDGGGGNLGYMAQGRREEKKEKKYLEESIFSTKPEVDTFEFDKKEPEMPDEKFSLSKFTAELIYKLKNIFTNRE